MQKNSLLIKNVKFLVVGGIGVIINYCAYKFLSMYVHNDIAWLIGVLVSAELNFILNSRWTFND